MQRFCNRFQEAATERILMWTNGAQGIRALSILSLHRAARDQSDGERFLSL
jgi:hypothetical protein